MYGTEYVALANVAILVAYLALRFRKRLVRPKLWVLMVAIAIVGVVMYASVRLISFGGWGTEARAKAAGHRIEAKLHRQSSSFWAKQVKDCDDGGGRQLQNSMIERWRRRAAAEAELADYHCRMAQKYRAAARFPWLPVPDDPAEPNVPGQK